MPDITMCHDSDCPMKENCYRFTAIPCSLGQSFFIDSPRNENICDYQISLNNTTCDKLPKLEK